MNAACVCVIISTWAYGFRITHVVRMVVLEVCKQQLPYVEHVEV